MFVNFSLKTGKNGGSSINPLVVTGPNFRPNSSFQHNSPKVTFKENKNDYTMQVVTPGMEKKDLSVDVKDNMLTVSGQYEREVAQKKGNRVISQEQVTSNFTQSFTLPENADIDKITSKYENGVLSITIPKDLEKVKEKTTSIAIQ